MIKYTLYVRMKLEMKADQRIININFVYARYVVHYRFVKIAFKIYSLIKKNSKCDSRVGYGEKRTALIIIDK